METTTRIINQSATEPTYLYNLGPLSRVPRGEGRSFELEGLQIAVFHTREGTLYATQAHCSHKGGPLADGLIGAGKVICPLHAYKFALASGEALGHGCPTLQTYAVSLNSHSEILLAIEQMQPVQSDQ